MGKASQTDLKWPEDSQERDTDLGSLLWSVGMLGGRIAKHR